MVGRQLGLALLSLAHPQHSFQAFTTAARQALAVNEHQRHGSAHAAFGAGHMVYEGAFSRFAATSLWTRRDAPRPLLDDNVTRQPTQYAVLHALSCVCFGTARVRAMPPAWTFLHAGLVSLFIGLTGRRRNMNFQVGALARYAQRRRLTIRAPTMWRAFRRLAFSFQTCADLRFFRACTRVAARFHTSAAARLTIPAHPLRRNSAGACRHDVASSTP